MQHVFALAGQPLALGEPEADEFLERRPVLTVRCGRRNVTQTAREDQIRISAAGVTEGGHQSDKRDLYRARVHRIRLTSERVATGSASSRRSQAGSALRYSRRKSRPARDSGGTPEPSSLCPPRPSREPPPVPSPSRHASRPGRPLPRPPPRPGRPWL